MASSQGVLLGSSCSPGEQLLVHPTELMNEVQLGAVVPVLALPDAAGVSFGRKRMFA